MQILLAGTPDIAPTSRLKLLPTHDLNQSLMDHRAGGDLNVGSHPVYKDIHLALGQSRVNPIVVLFLLPLITMTRATQFPCSYVSL